MSLDRRLHRHFETAGMEITVDMETALSATLQAGRRRRRIRAAAIAAGSLCLVAIAASSIPTLRTILSRDHASTPPAASSPDRSSITTAERRLAGTYTIRLPSPGLDSFLRGTYNMQMTPTGHIDMQVPKGFWMKIGVPSGVTYKATRHRIVIRGFTDHCLVDGTYAWERTGHDLRFRTLNDPCRFRRELFASRIWHRS